MTFIFKQLLAGQWADAQSGQTRAVINPATEAVVAEVPFGGAADAQTAIEHAKAALPAWSALTAYDRGAILRRIADLIRARQNEIAEIMTSEAGKPLAESRGELNASADLFDWFAEEGKRAYGRLIPARRANKRLMSLPVPVGVVAAITAWNFPALLLSRKISASLAAGCTVVARPSEITPLTGMALATLIQQALSEANAPTGTFNLVCGDPAMMGAVFTSSPLVNKISFTGSQRVGSLLMAQAASTVKRLSLELGGNAPVLVFADADVEQAAKMVGLGKFRNNGQTCIAPNRVFVHQSIYEDFLEASKAYAESLVVGNGLQANVALGPMVTAAGRDKVEALVSDAASKGAKIVTGGKRPSTFERGFFYEPTILAGIDENMALYSEEIFGPALPVGRFSSLAEGLALANNTPYGLAAYLISKDFATITRAYEGLDYGVIGVNELIPATAEAPFGGLKQSGFGREGSVEGLQAYMDTKFVAITLPG
jgi:succinate-semialdehyde dehydrogenase / glutarate-semialdehyde dehydrogenase